MNQLTQMLTTERNKRLREEAEEKRRAREVKGNN